MRNNFLSIICLMLTVSLFAQEIPFTIKKSEVFKDEYKNSYIALTKNDGNDGVVMVRSYVGGPFSSGFGYYFEHYDANLKLIKEYDYEIKYSKAVKRSSVLGLIMDGPTIHIIDFIYEKDQNAYICSSKSANINDFNFTSKELFRVDSEEIKQSGLFSGASYDDDSWASMILNADKTSFAITVDIKNKNAETHKLFLYDQSLTKKLERTFQRDIKDRKFQYENIEIGKDGSLYLLGKVYTEESKKKKEGGKYQFELTRITENSEKTQTFDTKEHYSSSLSVIVNDDKLSCLGFYSDRNDNRYKGICFFSLNPITLAIESSKFNPFTEQFMIDKYGKNKEKELKNLSFRSIKITNNKDIIFNAEEYYSTTTYVSNQYGGSSRTIFHYDDIVSAKLNASGSIVWARNINKRQATSGDMSFISYTSTVKDNDAYFFINTGEKVKKLSNDRIQFGQTTTKKSNLNIIRINEDGNFDYKEVLDDKDNEVPFMVSDGVNSGNSTFFLGRKGRKKQILKITL